MPTGQPSSSRWSRFLILGGGVGLLMIISLGVGDVYVSPGDVLSALFGGGNIDITTRNIVTELRLPRILLSVIVGAGLGTAGAGYQGMFRNPLADPFVIGASSGAAFGAAVAIMMQWGDTPFGWGAVPVSAMAGAMLAVGIVYGIASAGGKIPTVSLLLAGIAVSSIFSSMVALIMFMNEEKLARITGWLMGSFAGANWDILWPTAAVITCCASLLWFFSRGLDVLTFGEESAASLGFQMSQIKFIVILLATLATATAVAAGGIIGFIGLLAPHGARMLFGARHARVIPASALIGGALLLLADDVSRSAMDSRELPVGVICALLGSPFFLYLLKTRQYSIDAEAGG
ncbi:putative ABC transporter permease protein [Polystyrenella longa]|uniref:Putative ABC transporter permease protein n=1 Tax=Polystyrenella longa TaxID=2528007 RepID=A0A518CQF9_9PLAN|nr:iron ABC transporter permease [Polystyrenella longa]QDU81462.1 putative ABC transporter permease protein [Polystyrenella longa]